MKSSKSIISQFIGVFLLCLIAWGNAAAYDFNGDGKSDILWRNEATGETYMYLMDGNVKLDQGPLSIVSSVWRVVGEGDYDGDGKSDILWRNKVTGQNVVYLMNGLTIVSEQWVITVSDTDWQVVGDGDYNGDGKADILWRHAGTGQNHIWFMNGTTIASQGTVNFVPTAWRVVGSGDMNGDGKSDILWRNSVTGRNHVYLMNGNVIAGQGTINTVPLNWEIVGKGDYDGDGKSDILWRNMLNGRVHIYLMNGFAIASQGTVGAVPLDWWVVGDGGYDGDGKSDIMWRNMTPGDGRDYMYFMNGPSVIGQGLVNAVSNFNWEVVNDPSPAAGTAISSGPPRPKSNSDSATFNLLSDAAAATFECSIDGGAWGACTSSVNYPGLGDSEHTFCSRSDLNGNIDPTPVCYTWTVDTIAPDTTIDSGPPQPKSNSASATFTFSSSEPAGATFECRMDAEAWGACTSSKTYNGLGQGVHTFYVRATDDALPVGNTDLSEASYTWEVDTLAPDTTIDNGPPQPKNNSSSATFTFSSSEPAGATFECRMDAGAWGACTSSKTYNGLGDGLHTFDVRATDDALPVGNTDQSPASYSWEVDTTPPDSTIGSGPPQPKSNSASATFTFSSNELGSFECRMDGGAWEPSCISPKTYNGLSDAEHTFDVRATDDALPVGNTDQSPASYSWTVDTTPPDTTLDIWPLDPSNSSSAQFQFSCNEAVCTYECRLDGGAWGECASPKDYAGLSELGHTFEVRAIDDALPVGNTDPTSASFGWTVDTIAPASPGVIINSGAATTLSRGLTLSLSATDAQGVTAYCAIDNDTGVVPATPSPADPCWTGIASATNYSADVFHESDAYTTGTTIWVYAWFRDAAGNVSAPAAPDDILFAFEEGWEGGWGTWYADNGVWQVGTPTTAVAPVECTASGGTNCAGTVLDGYYGAYTDSRLISPVMVLGTVTGAEEIHLRFQNWFSYSTADSGQVQVQVWDAATSTWGAWVNEGVPVQNTSGGWSLKDVDLTAYAGDTVRIAFYHTATRPLSYEASESWGWYIDDIQIVVKEPAFSGDFEGGWDDWGAERGLWQVGTPTPGGGCFNGTGCAGTVLDGNYGAYTNSRLVSATMTLPAVIGSEEIHLRFQNWFSYSAGDSGQVQVQVWDAATSTWGAWVNEGVPVQDWAGVWSLKDVDLTAYAGETVRIAFTHVATRPLSYEASESWGWYIDDIQIVVKEPAFSGDFEGGWDDWGAERGLWQVGVPTPGGGCFNGTGCAGTVLDGNYGAYTDSRLVSATMTLPAVIGIEEIHLRFQNWFSYSTGDYGQVQVQVWDAATSTWGAWTNEGVPVNEWSGVWSLKDVDLTAYAGETVRIAFTHVATRPLSYAASESWGWYIDDVQIVVKTPAFTGDFEAGWDDWGAERGLWQVGTPTGGPAGCAVGAQCAGTVLDNYYGAYTNSRLVSATMTLPAVIGFEDIHLRFQNWFSYSTGDSGQIQIQEWDVATSTWGAWTNEGTPVQNTSGWSLKDVILTAYAGKTVRIAFTHTATRPLSYVASESWGWYIDDVVIQKF